MELLEAQEAELICLEELVEQVTLEDTHQWKDIKAEIQHHQILTIVLAEAAEQAVLDLLDQLEETQVELQEVMA
jgi:ABC-type branched-subunit amino acid transport system ATPase component